MDLNSIIIEEYKFYASYSLRILEDRAGAFSMYVGSFAATAAILAFANQASPQIFIFPNIAYLYFLFGIVHTYFFVRLGYLDKKYNTSLNKMNKIRALFLKNSGKNSKTISEILSPVVMPRTFGVFYPLFPATTTFFFIATVFYLLAVFLICLNWDTWYHSVIQMFLEYLNNNIFVNKVIASIIAGIVIISISFLVHYKIAKADQTA